MPLEGLRPKHGAPCPDGSYRTTIGSQSITIRPSESSIPGDDSERGKWPKMVVLVGPNVVGAELAVVEEVVEEWEEVVVVAGIARERNSPRPLDPWEAQNFPRTRETAYDGGIS